MTRSTKAGPGAYALQPGQTQLVLFGVGGCITLQNGKGGDLLFVGVRVPSGQTQAICCNRCGTVGPPQMILECDSAGPACVGQWRVDD